MKTTGIELISKEREEQISKHHRTIEKDVENNSYKQLAGAAHGLLAKDFDEYPPDYFEVIPPGWNEESYKKMFDKPYKERLIIAGALIAAELDRLENL